MRLFARSVILCIGSDSSPDREENPSPGLARQDGGPFPPGGEGTFDVGDPESGSFRGSRRIGLKGRRIGPNTQERVGLRGLPLK